MGEQSGRRFQRRTSLTEKRSVFDVFASGSLDVGSVWAPMAALIDDLFGGTIYRMIIIFM